MKERYQNPERYKEHLKKQSEEHWELSKSGGVSEEMSIAEAQRKRRVREAQNKSSAEEKRLAEEKRKRDSVSARHELRRKKGLRSLVLISLKFGT